MANLKFFGQSVGGRSLLDHIDEVCIVGALQFLTKVLDSVQGRGANRTACAVFEQNGQTRGIQHGIHLVLRKGSKTGLRHSEYSVVRSCLHQGIVLSPYRKRQKQR